MTGNNIKHVIAPLQDAMKTCEEQSVRQALAGLFAPDAQLKLFYPVGTLSGPDDYWSTCLKPLMQAMPDLERRDMIVLSGTTPQGEDWIGTMGNYMGTFTDAFLGVPPTGHLAHMRYHEFYKIADGKVVEMQAIWDIPELMMLANAWPMAPQLGAYLCTPAPMSGDGLQVSGDGQDTMSHVLAMLTDLCRYPSNPDPSVMQLEKYWHPRLNWYGPAGIGTARGISGFRNWHQIPFLNGMPDRRLDSAGDLMSNWFAEGAYVCETGWPNMRLTLSGDGWMGIAPVNKEVLLCSLDFWRMEHGLIRENWVLVDLLDAYAQVGVDVLGRLAEFNKARVPGAVKLPSGRDSPR